MTLKVTTANSACGTGNSYTYGIALVVLAVFVFGGCRNRVESVPAFPAEEADTSDSVRELVLSPFDSLFKEYSDSVFDWKLLAAIACVESGFDSSLVSGRGAFGLMQMMPSTYRQMLSRIGISDTDTVSNALNVYAAVQQLNDMDRLFGFIGKEERLNYVLAGYNCGHGHVFDAMRIARKNGINRYLWKNIEDVFTIMSDEEVYMDTLTCRYGRFEGVETSAYVRKVKNKYDEYCRLDSASVHKGS